MNLHAITDKKEFYIQIVKTIVSWLILCFKKKRWTPRRNSPNVGIAPRHPIKLIISRRMQFKKMQEMQMQMREKLARGMNKVIVIISKCSLN